LVYPQFSYFGEAVDDATVRRNVVEEGVFVDLGTVVVALPEVGFILFPKNTPKNEWIRN
jgi:hypothetical protein